jgi:hypothetical protein
MRLESLAKHPSHEYRLVKPAIKNLKEAVGGKKAEGDDAQAGSGWGTTVKAGTPVRILSESADYRSDLKTKTDAKWFDVVVLGGKSKGKRGWLPIGAVCDPVKITKVAWRPLSEHDHHYSILDVYCQVPRSSEDDEFEFTVCLWATEVSRAVGPDTRRSDGVKGLPPPGPPPIAEVRDKLIATAGGYSRASSKEAKEVKVELRITEGYERVMPIKLRVGLQSLQPEEADKEEKPEPLVDVPLAEPDPLSFELQATAPLADKRTDRLELWFRLYARRIRQEADWRGVDPIAIAGPIAWEALENVRATSLRGVGPGKVHLSDNPLDVLWGSGRGSGVARQIEDRGGLFRQRTVSERKELLKNPYNAIDYIAAILGEYAKIAYQEYAKAKKDVPADGPHGKNAALLCNFYQGLKPPGWGDTYLDLDNADKYFADKAANGGAYKLRSDPREHTDAWVALEGNQVLLRKWVTFTPKSGKR